MTFPSLTWALKTHWLVPPQLQMQDV